MPKNSRGQHTPLFYRQVARSAHATLTRAGDLQCAHCGKVFPNAKRINSVSGHLSHGGCPEYDSFRAAGFVPATEHRESATGGPTVDDFYTYLRSKIDDPEERLAILVGFIAATEAWPALADAPPMLWAFTLAVVVVVITAVVSDSKYLSARIPDHIERELVLERDRQLSRFNIVQKTVQGGFGLALGLGVAVLDDYFHLGLLDGGVIDQVVQVARLLVGA